MDRPRRRRPTPDRTGPIRNAGEAWRDREPRQDAGWPWNDAASRGVREGYQVIDEQIRRGHRMAQTMYEEDDYGPSYREPGWRHERRGGYHLLEMPMRHLEILVREILCQLGSARPDPWRLAELIFHLQLEALSKLTGIGGYHRGHHHQDHSCYRDDLFYEDVTGIGCDIDETLHEIQDEPWSEWERAWPWPPGPSTPATIRSTVPIPVYVSSHERTEIDLDLPAGAQSLELEVELPVMVGAKTAALPEVAFEAEFVRLADRLAVLRIEVPGNLPAGLYLRRILNRTTGEPLGDLTVQVGSLPKENPAGEVP